MEVELIVVDREASLHRPGQAGRPWDYSSYFHQKVHVLRLEVEFKADQVGILKDRLGSEVALSQDSNHLEQWIHAFIETAGAFVSFDSVLFRGEAGVDEELAFEAVLTSGCLGLADA